MPSIPCQRSAPSVTISGSQRPSVSGNQGYQWPSVTFPCHQSVPSVAVSGHQMHSEAIKGYQ